ncbi:MAG: TIR domain-containing protein [Candidatus Hodarchaeota archaeon]
MKFNHTNINRKNPEPIFDVFVSYNSSERNEVEQFLERLHDKNKKLKIWYDQWCIPPGVSWSDAIEDALPKSKSMVVCVGSSGFGPWHNKELKAWMRKYCYYERPIIPVIFSSAEKTPKLPVFLEELKWVNFHDHGEDEAIKLVLWGITGKRPPKKFQKIKPEPKEKIDKICKDNFTFNASEGNIDMDSLQEQINKTSKGGILELQFGEFHGELEIKKAITIRSNQLTVTFVGNSPTVNIQSKDVMLENINIVSNDENGVCLSVKKGCNPKFKNVFLKGNVEGLEHEEGDWDIPDVLNLAIIPNEVTNNRFIINCPVAAKIYPSDTDIIKCEPHTLTSGYNELELTIKEIPKGNVITGALIIETENYKLKRKISLCGNTLNDEIDTSTYQDKLIWQPESYTTMNLPDILPEGMQGEPYEYVLDEEKIGCKDYEITVEGLPDGLRFNPSSKPPKIEVNVKIFGNFSLKFIFKKDETKCELTSQLIIDEKKIIPLEIAPIPDPLSSKEDEMIKYQIQVIRSNSPNLTYQVIKDLPEGLNLNDTGEIWGKIERHGKYESTIKINDGTNELLQDIKFLIEPKDTLKIVFDKSNQVYKNREFNIPVEVIDADTLSPKLKIMGKKPDNIKIVSTQDGFVVIGILNKEEVHHIDFVVEDIYSREVTETISIICKEKPTYTINWLTPSTFPVIGEIGKSKHEKIKAEIKEDKNLLIKYYLINKLPSNIKLNEDGELIVKIIRDDSYILRIRAEYGEYESEQEFVINVKRETKPVKGTLSEDSIFLRKEKELETSIEKTGLSEEKKDELKLGKAFQKREESTSDKPEKIDDKKEQSNSKVKLGGAFKTEKKINKQFKTKSSERET